MKEVATLVFLVSMSIPCHCRILGDYGYVHQGKPEIFERIITDQSDLYLGYDIDYRYNESSGVVYDRLHSVPGCPKSLDGYPWVLYGNPPKCHLSGLPHQPCGSFKTLRVERGSQYGVCNCECLEESEDVIDSSNKNYARFCHLDPSDKSLEFVFLPALKNCFQLYGQEPCKMGEWLVKVEHKDGPPSTRCEKRTCPEGYTPSQSRLQRNGVIAAGNCIDHPPMSGYSYLTKSECAASGMKYSELLGMCVRKFKYFL